MRRSGKRQRTDAGTCSHAADIPHGWPPSGRLPWHGDAHLPHPKPDMKAWARLQVFEWLVFSDPKRDAHRFADAVRAAVAEGRARDYKRFRTWAAGVDARPRPKDPLAPRGSGARKVKKKGGGDEQALVAQIRRGTTDRAERLVLGARAKAAISEQGLLHSSACLGGQAWRNRSCALPVGATIIRCWQGPCQTRSYAVTGSAAAASGLVVCATACHSLSMHCMHWRCLGTSCASRRLRLQRACFCCRFGRGRAAGAAGADALLASLEARYCSSRGARKGGPRGGEPPEEAFAAARARATAAEPAAKGAKPARKRAKT